MAVARGRQLNAGYAKEATRLTAETTSAKWLPCTEFSVQSMNEYNDDSSAIGNLNALIGKNLEFVTVSGSIGGKIRVTNIGELLYHLFGNVDTTTVESGVYKHTFTIPSDIAIDTMSLFFNEPNTGDLVLNGCIVNSLELSSEVQGDSSFNAGIIGLAQATVASQTPSYDDETKILQSRHCKLWHADTLAGLSAGTEINAKSVNIGISTNGEVDAAIGNLNAVDVFQGEFSYTLTGSAIIKSSDFLDWESGNIKRAFRAGWIDTTTTIGATSNPSLYIEFPPSEITYDRQNSLGDLVSADFEVHPRFNFSDGLQARVVLINEIASY